MELPIVSVRERLVLAGPCRSLFSSRQSGSPVSEIYCQQCGVYVLSAERPKCFLFGIEIKRLIMLNYAASPETPATGFFKL